MQEEIFLGLDDETWYEDMLKNKTVFVKDSHYPSRRFGIKIKMPYNATFLSEFKALVPANCRVWSNQLKCWFYIADNRTRNIRLKDLLHKHFPDQCIGLTRLTLKCKQ